MKKRELRIFLFFTFLILLSFKQIYSQEEEEKEEIEIYDKASNNPSQESNSYHDHEFPHPDPVFVKEEHYPQFITKKSGSNIGAWEQSSIFYFSNISN